MAGLFDSIGSDPVAAQRIKEQAAALEQQSEALRNLRPGLDTAGQVGLAIGGALGGGFGRGIADRIPGVPDSPEMELAKRQAGVLKTLQGFDLSTSEGLQQAAKAVRDQGDDATALKLVVKAGETRKAEAAAKAKAEQQAAEEARAEFKKFPAAVQEEIVAKSPEQLVTALGISAERANEIASSVEERNALQRAKLEKTANEIKKATQVKVSGTDVEQSTTVVSALTAGQFDETPEQENVARIVAARAQQRINKATDAGQTVDVMQERAKAFEELKAEGVIKHNPGSKFAGITFGEALEIDPEKLAGALATADAAPTANTPPVPGARKAPDGNWYSPDPNRPGKWIKH